MIKRKNTNAQENKDQCFGRVCQSLIGNLEHFPATAADVWCCIQIEEKAVDQDCYDTAELESISNKVGNPGCHYHHGDFGIEGLLLHVVLLPGIQSSFVFVCGWDVD